MFQRLRKMGVCADVCIGGQGGGGSIYDFRDSITQIHRLVGKKESNNFISVDGCIKGIQTWFKGLLGGIQQLCFDKKFYPLGSDKWVCYICNYNHSKHI